MTPQWIAVLMLTLAACTTVGKLGAPATPYRTDTPRVGEIPDPELIDVIRKGDLIVLGTPVDRVSEAGFFTPKFQMGARETWYTVKIAVDSVVKGKLRSAKKVDLGMLPVWMNPGPPFPSLEANEIVVQYPETESPNMHWGLAPVLNLGERAVFIFKKCWYCLPLTGVANPRGPYYVANPWVAMSWGSKLPPDEWSRVVRLTESLRSPRASR